jgi:hypothetical protein
MCAVLTQGPDAGENSNADLFASCQQFWGYFILFIYCFFVKLVDSMPGHVF